MRLECLECGGNRQCESSCSRTGRGAQRNDYLGDTFGAYQGFWLRQSQFWYEAIGRFVVGQYRAEDASKDIAAYWDGWMADYQRALQFPFRKAQIGHVPNVVFVLDQPAQGAAPKQVPIWFGLGRVRPDLVASALLSSTGQAASGAYIKGQFDDRGEYATIRLVNAGVIPEQEAHYTCVVHTDGPSGLPVAVVHVVRREIARQQAAGSGQEASPTGSAPGAQQPGDLARKVGALHHFVQEQSQSSIAALNALFASRNEFDRRIAVLEEVLAAKGR